MSWQELKKILIEKITQGNYDALEILCVIVADADLLSDITNLSAQHRRDERMYRINILSEEDLKKFRSKIHKGLFDIIKEITENELKKDWREEELVKNLIDNRYNEDTFTEHEIQLTIEKNLIQVPKTAGLIKPKNEHRYKTELMKAQDLMVIGDYYGAFEYCNRVKTKLEMESPQLYEFMLITFFYKEGVENIVNDAFTGNGEKLKYLKLYADRCYTLNELLKKKNPDQQVSDTTQDTIEKVLQNLAKNLKYKYATGMSYDYIINNRASSDKKVIAFLINFFEIVDDLTTKFRFKKDRKNNSKENNQTDKLLKQLLEDALHELNGGGKIDWLEFSFGDNLKNKRAYNALIKRSEIEKNIIQILDTNKESVSDFKTKIENRLWLSLSLKYNNIIYATFQDNYYKKLAVIKVMQSLKIAFQLYKNTQFLEIIYTELTGLDITKTNDDEILEGNSCYFNDWFILDSNGNLGSLLSPQLKIDLNEYLIFATNHLNIKNKTAVFDNIRHRLAKEISQKQSQIYAHLVNSNTKTENDRKTVAMCISMWFVCYEILRKKELLNAALNELSGKGLFNWFEFSNKGDFEPHIKTVEILNFSPDLLMKKIMYHSFSKDADNDIIRKEIQTNIYNRILSEMRDELNNVEKNARFLDKNNYYINFIKKCEKGYYNFDRKDDVILNLAKDILSKDDFINRLFYLKLNNLGSDEIDSVKQWLSKMPSVKSEFLDLIVDKARGEAYIIPSLYAPKRHEVTDDFRPFFYFLFTPTSLVFYLITWFFLVYSIANEYYFIELKEIWGLLTLNFFLIFLSIIFRFKNKKVS